MKKVELLAPAGNMEALKAAGETCYELGQVEAGEKCAELV